MSCYVKEIYYYTHGGSDIDEELFEDCSMDEFIPKMRAKRKTFVTGKRPCPMSPLWSYMQTYIAATS